MRYVIDDTQQGRRGAARRAHARPTSNSTRRLAGKVAIAATELANNLLRHARRRRIARSRRWAPTTSTVVELLAIDRGPGMTDVARCMSDGYSTGGTPGTGLGAVRRLADEFDIYSAPGEGTIVMARFGAGSALRYGAVSVAMPRRNRMRRCVGISCSDAKGTAVFVVDGLGHGTLPPKRRAPASTRSRARPVRRRRRTSCSAPMALMSKTRGGAAAARDPRWATMFPMRASATSPATWSRAGKSQGLVSHNGTLGLHQRRAQQFEYTSSRARARSCIRTACPRAGISKNRPDLLRAHPAIIAAASIATTGADATMQRSWWWPMNAELQALLAAATPTSRRCAKSSTRPTRAWSRCTRSSTTRPPQLRDANELKSRFLSYMSHEFRTPLTSMTSITGILLSRLDGPLTAEQQKQVEFIRTSARELTEMVNDLLDLAKVEAGRITISPEWFEMVDLFAALRGMFKPIVATTSVSLVFDEPRGRDQAVHRRQEGLADPAQFHFQRAQVHAGGRSARLRARARRTTGGIRGDRHRHRHRRRAPARTCSRISCSSTCGCRGACAAPDSDFRWRASSPSCSAAKCAWRASSARVRASG